MEEGGSRRKGDWLRPTTPTTLPGGGGKVTRACQCIRDAVVHGQCAPHCDHERPTLPVHDHREGGGVDPGQGAGTGRGTHTAAHTLQLAGRTRGKTWVTPRWSCVHARVRGPSRREGAVCVQGCVGVCLGRWVRVLEEGFKVG